MNTRDMPLLYDYNLWATRRILPAWTPGWFLYWQVPATVFMFVVYMGKVLIDTILFPKR